MMVLRGVFMGTRAELDWFYGGGAARFFPPNSGRNSHGPYQKTSTGDLIAAYSKRLFSGDIH